MSKITRTEFNSQSRNRLINSYKERSLKCNSLVNRSSGDFIGHRYTNTVPVKRSIVTNERGRSRTARKRRHLHSGDIIGHRASIDWNKKRNDAFERRRKKLREIKGMCADKNAGDIIQHRDTRSVMSRQRPRSARKIRPKLAMFRNGDIVTHRDDHRFKTSRVFGRRPASARKSRVKLTSGDIISHTDKNKFSVKYKVGKKMVDSPRFMKKSGGKRMGYGNMRAQLHGTVPVKGYTVFKRSPRKVKVRRKRN